jgi:uncharacterized membrane protein YphA (DoxX/SURF4 family)
LVGAYTVKAFAYTCRGFLFSPVPPRMHGMPTALRMVLQIFVGVVIFGSALGKSLDLPGFVEVLKTYQIFPDLTLWPLALAVTGFEFVLGAWLLSGWRLRAGALVALWLNAGYAAWMTISLLRGLELSNCGCFGVFFPQPLRWYSPLEDLVLVGMCYALSREPALFMAVRREIVESRGETGKHSGEGPRRT